MVLRAVEDETLDPRTIDRDLMANLAAFDEEDINRLVQKHWGAIRKSPAEIRAQVISIESIAKYGSGRANTGKMVFEETCAKCHVLHGVGRAVGPELTGMDRRSLSALVADIIDPDRSIEPEYAGTLFTIASEIDGSGADEQLVTGFLIRETAQEITVVDSTGTELTVRKEHLRSMEPMTLSIMPEGLLDGMTDQELRDLFKFIQSNP
jgi:putative heme-binding domain-containing protein